MLKISLVALMVTGFVACKSNQKGVSIDQQGKKPTVKKKQDIDPNLADLIF
jgi:hypothetical protein